MTALYVSHCRMPHNPPNSLQLPPTSGWPNIDITTLKARGKSDEAAEFLRHIPFLSHGTYLTHNTQAIDFSKGETCPAWAEEGLLETPEEVMWIGVQDSRDGLFLLLDTKHGTITEFGPLNNICRLPYEEYKALPVGDRWMVHSTLTAVHWFERERLRVEQLIYMTVPDANNRFIEFHFRAKSLEDEQDIINGLWDHDDGNYIDSDSGERGSTDESDGASSEDEESLTAELQDLDKEDSGLMRPHIPVTAEYSPDPGVVLHPESYHDVHFGTEKPEVAQVLAIYTCNGWFDGSWDRECCRGELVHWANERSAARREVEEVEKKAEGAELEAAKQKRLEQHLKVKRILAEEGGAPEAGVELMRRDLWSSPISWQGLWVHNPTSLQQPIKLP